LTVTRPANFYALDVGIHGLFDGIDFEAASREYPGIHGLFIFEISVGLGVAALSAFSMVVFFMKMRVAKLFMILVFSCSLLSMTVDSAWAFSIIGTVDPKDILDTVRSSIVCACWIAYFCMSDRVKYTFVK
jgi:hypothetical protein